MGDPVVKVISLKDRRGAPLDSGGAKFVSAAKKLGEVDTDNASGVYPIQSRLAFSETRTFALHDAKNLTCALAASVEWLRTQYSIASADREVVEAVRDMSSTCAELTELLSQALAASRSGGTVLSLSRERAMASELTRQVQRRYRARAAILGVELAVESGEDAALSVDRVLWARVIDNLVDNALRAAPPGSQVSLFYGQVGDDVVFSVSDQGRGVPEAQRDAIFGMFVGSAPKTERTAFGVGLAFCRRVVEAHGGELTVSDSPGGGATFVAKIPTVEA